MSDINNVALTSASAASAIASSSENAPPESSNLNKYKQVKFSDDILVNINNNKKNNISNEHTPLLSLAAAQKPSNLRVTSNLKVNKISYLVYSHSNIGF